MMLNKGCFINLNMLLIDNDFNGICMHDCYILTIHNFLLLIFCNFDNIL